MRAKKIFLLIPLLFMAVSAVFAMPQNDIVSDVMQKDAALGQHQRSVRDSIGALVRREMMTHVGESRSQADSVSGMRLQVRPRVQLWRLRLQLRQFRPPLRPGPHRLYLCHAADGRLC